MRCGAEAREYLAPILCACGLRGSFVPLADDGESAAATPAGPRPIRLDEAPPELPRRATGERGIDRLMGGGFVLGSTVTVYGRAGAGKSTLCLRWATLLGVTVVSCPEMSVGILRATAARAGARLDRLYLSSPESWQRDAAELSATCVVCDSVSRSPQPGAELARLIAWAQRSEGVAFAVAHRSKKGSPLGPAALSHDPDAVVQVRPRAGGLALVRIEKARFAPQAEAVCSLAAAPRTPAKLRRVK